MTRGFLLAAPASGQGKTLVTLGLLRALRDRGLAVASAKSGPDYIDPAFHAAATGRACATLDPWAADPAQLRARAVEALSWPGPPAPDQARRAAPAAAPATDPARPFAATDPSADLARPAVAAELGRAPADLLVIEGAMGLFDGAATGAPLGQGSSADLAAALSLPVVLVLDVAHMGQGAAAIVAGLARYRPDVRVAGVILNRVGSPRHGAMVAAAVATVAPVLGAIPRDPGLGLPSRHLGLVQAAEHPDLAAFITRAAALVAASCDLGALEALAAPLAPAAPPRRLTPLGQRIAVARDAAFGFAYTHLLADWHAQGAEVLPFSPLADQAPDPGADALYLPGGYPELWPGVIAAAATFHQGIHAAAARGALIYGECGGYMVLGRGLVAADGTRHQMLGLLPLETGFDAPRRHLGYRRLTPLAGPWRAPLLAHEFHYASTLTTEGPPLFQATDAAAEPLPAMGLAIGRTLGSFAHVIETG